MVNMSTVVFSFSHCENPRMRFIPFLCIHEACYCFRLYTFGAFNDKVTINNGFITAASQNRAGARDAEQGRISWVSLVTGVSNSARLRTAAQMAIASPASSNEDGMTVALKADTKLAPTRDNLKRLSVTYWRQNPRQITN